jgi:phosphate transport system protein
VRTAFHQQLDALTVSISDMCGLAGEAMQHATQALLQADLELAEQVITDYDEIVLEAREIEDRALKVLALQAPVASDLRAVVSSIKNIADIERMAVLALHVALST